MAVLREQDVADRLDVSVQTVRLWRVNGKGPAYHKVSRNAVRYESADVEKFWNDCKVERGEPANQ